MSVYDSSCPTCIQRVKDGLAAVGVPQRSTEERIADALEQLVQHLTSRRAVDWSKWPVR